MIYYQQQPHQELKDYVRCYWKIKNKQNVFLNYSILPDGFFDLLICLHKNTLESVFLTGLWNSKTDVVIPPETTIYGVQFRLLAIENIIQENISSILNDFKDLKHSYLKINQFNKNIDSNLFEYLNQTLLSHIEKQSEIESKKSILLKSINQTKGNKSVEYYYQESCWSKRQINRYFQVTFGLSLKSYCSIRRGSSTFSQIRKGELFEEQSYFDQSHFIKEIKKITGFTPKILSKNENDRFLQFSIIKTE